MRGDTAAEETRRREICEILWYLREIWMSNPAAGIGDLLPYGVYTNSDAEVLIHLKSIASEPLAK